MRIMTQELSCFMPALFIWNFACNMPWSYYSYKAGRRVPKRIQVKIWNFSGYRKRLVMCDTMQPVQSRRIVVESRDKRMVSMPCLKTQEKADHKCSCGDQLMDIPKLCVWLWSSLDRGIAVCRESICKRTTGISSPIPPFSWPPFWCQCSNVQC